MGKPNEVREAMGRGKYCRQIGWPIVWDLATMNQKNVCELRTRKLKEAAAG